jgi:curli production assembly/transport component CsgF
MKKSIVVFLVFLFSVSLDVSAQEFVYTPINPAFGGETFNYQWLLSSAESQNLYTDDDEQLEETTLSEFTQSLNSQLLSRINRALLDAQINTEGGVQPGVYNFGSLNVQVYEALEGLVVDILDIDTGEQSQIIIPN